MSSLLSAELVATCNSLGYFDVQQNKYYADENTLESVKDLIRYLKRDDESHDIRRQLGETKVVQTDLLPLMKNYWEQTDLFDVLLRLLVNLTTPALMLWNEEIPTERTSRNQYLQIEEHLRLYKQAFTDEAVWAVLSTRISKILEVESGERADENGLIIERILILIRNILHVPADPDAEKRPDNDASVHDQVLWALHQSGMLDIILYVSSANEKAYYMHIIEIMCYMLREQNAKELASAALQRSQNEKMRDEAELLAIKHKESNTKQQKARVYSGSRHSRFGGTFVVKSMKSISENELIYHKPLSKLDDINFDGDKTKLKTPKNRAPLKSTTVERRSAFSIRLFLKEFCVEFLNGAYNTFMYVVKERLSRQQAQKHDETYYLWAIRFFLEFNRNYKFDIKLVSETMSVQAFQYIQRQLEQYTDMMSSDKTNVRLWAKRLHVALLAYKELIYTLCAMDKSPDDAVKASSKVIKSNIFYVLEYRELILHLMIQYNDITMPYEYLRDVIETQHVFLKLFQAHCSGKSLLVEEQRKKKRAPGKSKGVGKAKQKSKEKGVSVDLDALWRDTSERLEEYLDGSVAVREEVQWKVSGIIKEKIQGEQDGGHVKLGDLSKLGVQKLIVEHEIEEAIGLMLEVRELYPDLVRRFEEPPEQLDEFRGVFFKTLEDGLRPIDDPDDDGEQEPEVAHFHDEEDELENEYEMQESDLKFEDFSRRLAHPRIVRACGVALKQFEANSLLTNHCIVKLLHRIAFDSKMPTMLFQELVKFATYIIRQFFVVAEKNPSVFMEALFWKSARDACDIEEGYASYNEKSKAITQAWSEHEEDELRRLFVEHQENAIERDVVDWIIDNLVDNSKTRRAVLKKLKAMYLLVDYKAGKKSGPPKEFSDDEEQQLRELFAQFKDAMDPLTCIMDRLDVHRPKNRIVDKLLALGLVQDKKELRKKRIGKGKSKSGDSFQYVGEDINSEDDLSDQSEHSDDDSNPESTDKSSQHLKPSKINLKKPKKQKTKKTQVKPKISKQKITKMLIDLSDDLKQGIDWLKESIEDAAEDWEDTNPDSEDDGVPLVPILDYSIAAMENLQFLSLLQAMNIQEPAAGGQESYWRIPSSLSLADLQDFTTLLTNALEGNLTLEDTNIDGDTGSETVNYPNSERIDLFPTEDTEEHEELDEQNVGNTDTSIYFNDNLAQNKVASAIKRAKNEKLRAMIKKMVESREESADVELTIEGPQDGQQNINEDDPKSDNEDNESDNEQNVVVTKKKRIIEDSSESEESDGEELDRNVGEDESNRLSFRPARIHDFSDDDQAVTANSAHNEENTEEMFKSARIIMESDDDDDDTNQEEVFKLKKQAAKTNLLASASDEDSDADQDENKENSKKFNNQEENKRLRSTSDSETDKPKPKKSRVIISDDED